MAEKTKRVESLQEYLMRGGRIVIVPPVRPETDEVTVHSTGRHATGAASLLTLEEAELFYGEPRSSKSRSDRSSRLPAKKAKATSSGKDVPTVSVRADSRIDIDALPLELRKLLTDRLNKKE